MAWVRVSSLWHSVRSERAAALLAAAQADDDAVVRWRDDVLLVDARSAAERSVSRIAHSVEVDDALRCAAALQRPVTLAVCCTCGVRSLARARELLADSARPAAIAVVNVPDGILGAVRACAARRRGLTPLVDASGAPSFVLVRLASPCSFQCIVCLRSHPDVCLFCCAAHVHGDV